MMPILVKSDNIRSERKAKAHHSRLQRHRIRSQWVNFTTGLAFYDSNDQSCLLIFLCGLGIIYDPHMFTKCVHHHL